MNLKIFCPGVGRITFYEREKITLLSPFTGKDGLSDRDKPSFFLFYSNNYHI
jgi:hypothetical protein